MTTYQNKYKDRDPLDTINIVKSFFENRGYTIKEFPPLKSEIDTYSTHLDISLNGETVLGANGKGVTPEFARASGFAELYERFANRLNYYFSPIFCELYSKYQFSQKGYHFAPDERETTEEEILNDSPVVNQFLMNYGGNLENAYEAIRIVNGYYNQYYSVPYKRLGDESKLKYYNQPVLYRVTASNGLAAGNTEQEALNQGLSEVFERWATIKFLTEIQDTYYEIDINTINDEKLITLINNIKNLGHNVRIYDLSYNFHIPVTMIVIEHSQTYRFFINFASFPVFNISVERNLTEVYQGLTSLNNDYRVQLPGKTITGEAIIMQCPNDIGETPYFREDIFDKTIQVSYNKEVFLNSLDYNNSELLYKYYVDLCNKLGLNIYYRNNTLIPEMAAVHIFCDNIDTFDVKNPFLSTVPQKDRNDWIADMRAYLFNSKYMFSNIFRNTVSKDIYTQFMPVYPFMGIMHGNYVGCLKMTEWICALHPTKQTTGVLKWIQTIEDDDGIYDFEGLSQKERYLVKQYQTLQNYARDSAYNFEDVRKIFKEWKVELTQEDYNNCFYTPYLFYKIIVEPEKAIIDRGDYTILLNSFLIQEEEANE